MSLAAAVEALRRGGIVGVPTDTVYGLAADPFQRDALEAVFALKGRAQIKPIAILVASVDQGSALAAFGSRAADLADKHWPGALDADPAPAGDRSRLAR